MKTKKKVEESVTSYCYNKNQWQGERKLLEKERVNKYEWNIR